MSLNVDPIMELPKSEAASAIGSGWDRWVHAEVSLTEERRLSFETVRSKSLINLGKRYDKNGGLHTRGGSA
jgi:hypothetical protein